MWLAAVTAGMVSELVFILQGSSGVWPNELTPGGGWRQTIQVPLWASEMRALLPSFLRPFEAGPHPTLTVTSATLLRPTASIVGLPGNATNPLRARALQDYCPNSATAEIRVASDNARREHEMPCLHVVVVNVLEDTPVSFSIEVESPPTAAAIKRYQQQQATVSSAEAQLLGVLNATRLFDDGYNVTLGFRDNFIVLADYVGPGDTNIYEIGCDGPKPKQIAGPGGRTISPEWEPCANRRETCWDHTSQCSGV